MRRSSSEQSRDRASRLLRRFPSRLIDLLVCHHLLISSYCPALAKTRQADKISSLFCRMGVCAHKLAERAQWRQCLTSFLSHFLLDYPGLRAKFVELGAAHARNCASQIKRGRSCVYLDRLKLCLPELPEGDQRLDWWQLSDFFVRTSPIFEERMACQTVTASTFEWLVPKKSILSQTGSVQGPWMRKYGGFVQNFAPNPTDAQTQKRTDAKFQPGIKCKTWRSIHILHIYTMAMDSLTPGILYDTTHASLSGRPHA